jgi:hypothetical protein
MGSDGNRRRNFACLKEFGQAGEIEEKNSSIQAKKP